ncbi:hypothetical protein SRHO_G00176940, partial [Serrasalmus rhombeus]
PHEFLGTAASTATVAAQTSTKASTAITELASPTSKKFTQAQISTTSTDLSNASVSAVTNNFTTISDDQNHTSVMTQSTTHQRLRTSAASTITKDAVSTRNQVPQFFTEPVSEESLQPLRTTSAPSSNTYRISVAVTTTAGNTRPATTTNTSAISVAWLSTLATTAMAVPAKAGEGVIILQFRIQRVFIPAYNNPSSTEYKILVSNITAELDRGYREQFPLTFLRCYVLRLWAGSVGVDTQLIFQNETVLPNVTVVAESLKSAINGSKVFLDIILSSVTAVNIPSTTLDTNATTTTTVTTLHTQMQTSHNITSETLSSSMATSLPSTLITLFTIIIFFTAL